MHFLRTECLKHPGVCPRLTMPLRLKYRRCCPSRLFLHSASALGPLPVAMYNRIREISSMATGGLPAVCEWCSDDFFAGHGNLKKGMGRFCSLRCVGFFRRSGMPERFWAKVEKTSGCWLWKASITPNGYGKFWWEGRNHPAHRVAWELLNGPRPTHLIVCHNCPGGDNRACVRPDHLFLGTNKANSEDMVAKGRQSCGARHAAAILPNRPRGSKNANARYSEADVLEMRRLYDSGECSQHALARRFGTTQPVIHRIVTRKSWQHL